MMPSIFNVLGRKVRKYQRSELLYQDLHNIGFPLDEELNNRYPALLDLYYDVKAVHLKWQQAIRDRQNWAFQVDPNYYEGRSDDR